ncbi:MAG: hypothetical protein H7175_28735 [Burkholderiales bacterium]|nr:hypothetical protein [Anaerolineae bacterium]
MNDELNGQLTPTEPDSWRIPPYARRALWLESDAGTVKTEGEQGTFTLPAPAETLNVRWGGAEGPALARLRWQSDSLAWDGAVAVGGFVDAIHITEIDGMDFPMALVFIGGQPLKAGTTPYPAPAARTQVPYPPTNSYDATADDVNETVTTWLVGEESPLVRLAENALMNRLRVFCFGHLADAEGGWHKHFALPLLLESLTLFAP